MVIKAIKNKNHLHNLKPLFRFAVPLFLFGILLLFLTGLYPIVLFPEEQIDIEVYPDHVWVKGTYVYKNPFPFPVTQSLIIPFPMDSDHPEPFMLSASVIASHEKPIPLKYLLGVHRFRLNFAAKEEINVSVKYRQQSSTSTARYILISTKAWRRPLTRALYRIFPKGVRITSSNYELNQSDAFLFFKKEDFMPSKDWIFSWEVT